MTGDELLADVVARYDMPDGVEVRDVLRIRVSGGIESGALVACTIWVRNGDRWRYLLRSRTRTEPGWARSGSG